MIKNSFDIGDKSRKYLDIDEDDKIYLQPGHSHKFDWAHDARKRNGLIICKNCGVYGWVENDQTIFVKGPRASKCSYIPHKVERDHGGLKFL